MLGHLFSGRFVVRPAEKTKTRLRVELLEDRAVPTNLPPGFMESPVATGFVKPTCLEAAPDGRLFVCEKDGAVRIILPDGAKVPRPFLRVSAETTGERGLVGLTFHPDFETNGWVYIYYTVLGQPLHCRVSRFTANPTNPNVAIQDSEEIILELDDLESPLGYHVGGSLNFDNEGKLFVAVGEDGNGSNSQNSSNLLGKMLRIKDDGSIPADNPFVDVPGARGEIYAYGFRNPFGVAVQPKTGVLFVNDVGSAGDDAREEVNHLFYGGNYGWPIYEGVSNNPDYSDPLYDYPHGDDPETGGSNCAVTGGTFYGPGVRQFPREYVGDYFFTDFCGQWIRRLDPSTGAATVFATDTALFPVDLTVNSEGSMFYVAYDTNVYRIDYSGTAPEAVWLGIDTLENTNGTPPKQGPTFQAALPRTKIPPLSEPGSKKVEPRSEFRALSIRRFSGGTTLAAVIRLNADDSNLAIRTLASDS